MVYVGKNINLPIKLLVPLAYKLQCGIVGLGDILLPGIII